jgi:hypothetical protein
MKKWFDTQAFHLGINYWNDQIMWMRWTGNVAHMDMKRSAYEVLVGISKEITRHR